MVRPWPPNVPIPAQPSAPSSSRVGRRVAGYLVCWLLCLGLSIYANAAFGLLLLWAVVLPFPVVALPCGIVLLLTGRVCRRSSLANTGKVLSLFAVLTLPVLYLLVPLDAFVRPRPSEAVRRSQCANNLKRMGLVCKTYAYESPGEFFPVLSPKPGQLMMWRDAVYPDLLEDPAVLVCPKPRSVFSWRKPDRSDPKWIDDHSYFYLGYLVSNDEEMRAFADAYRLRVSEGLPFDEDLPAPAGKGSRGGNSFLLLREGLYEGFPDEESSEDPTVSARFDSEIVVMFDHVDNHIPGGGNILFLDGHVEFVRCPGRWPMTETTMAILEELDALGSPGSTEQE
jgi:prepilin-type processing-associated H-X9-DG protein